MDAETWLKEKELLRKLCGEIIVDVLWHPETAESHFDTKYHDITVRRAEKGVCATIIPKDF